MGLNSTDQNIKTASFLATLYWLGRLDGHGAPSDLENKMLDAITKTPPDELRSESMRCAEIMRMRGEELGVIGQHLIERGQQQDPVITP
jgi:hypothetical protein